MSHFVTVIGTIFIDCKGFAKQTYEAASRNLGSIQFVHGGVGRNVAENLANLDIVTSFVSTVDQSGIGNEVLTRLEKSGVQVANVKAIPVAGMGMWLAILDESGNLAGSISQMPNLDHLSDLLLSKADSIVQSSSHIVLEMDLNEPISSQIIQLAKKYKKPVYGIPGNLEVVLQYPTLLEGLACFICNHHEAGKLFLNELSELTPDAVLQLTKEYVQTSQLRSMVVTLGEKGSVYYDAIQQVGGFQPVFPVNLVDSSGAGDAFFSGTVMGLIRGFTLKESVVCGTKVAGWTIESEENNCQTLRQQTAYDPFFQFLSVPMV